MSEEEKGVLETFKKGYGLTKAETEILSNLIDKQQKEIDRLKTDKDILCGVIDKLKGASNE